MTVLGTSLLILPAPTVSGSALDWGRGLITAATGLALPWLGVVGGGRARSWVLAHLVLALPQVWFGLALAAAGTLSGLGLVILGGFVGLLPLLPTDAPTPRESSADLLTVMLFGLAALSGVLLVTRADPTWVIPGRVGLSELVPGIGLAVGGAMGVALALRGAAVG